ncbi:MAG TPA: bifunctional UDP-N-acetylglucosamine diphosphorylase/glucosamine-1-phosphate N-acetyltransferase GlmU [Candidatus Acidoferrales bacterium]|nr:bifunctional UDP-N-acetylglucosamine diphosphorylase/glucosamine-1-phosphate N-acetyltransferase GlmU [Candidatus Acidoferrales bacterium]
MANKDFAVLILAAGKGTRLKSNLAKVLHRAGGRTLVEHVVAACGPLRAKSIHVVVGHQADQVAAAIASTGAKTVLQQPQRGTGHAMLVARRALGGAKHVLVLPGDAPLIRTETLQSLIRTHRDGAAAASILTAVLADPSGYGRIIRRSDGRVAAIVEQSKLAENQLEINEINSSIYCFSLTKLWPAMARLKPDNVHRELYLTDAIALLAQQDETVLAQIAPDSAEILGCNTRAELAEVDRVFRRRAAARWMDAGVSIQFPDTIVIDPDVSIGQDTVIEPNVQLLGSTRIGADCVVRTGSVISDCTIADGVIVKPYSILNASRIAAAVQVGPFTHLREAADLRENSRIGNFVEVKKSTIGAGAKAMHLSYLGDAKIGEKTNIGAGTITCNYDGVYKNPTTIGRGVFIGSDTALVAPVRVGDGAYVGAGSVITENVPADALAIARGRQANKPGWARKRRREFAASSSKAARSHRPRRAANKKAARAKRASRRKSR